MKRIFSMLSALAVLIFLMSLIAEAAYYNAIYEVEQIQYLINRGYYLEAIQECDYTLTSFDLSPDDVSLIKGYISTAQQRYKDYINGADTYYNATAEVNQIRYFVNNGLYLEAIQDCENTLAWHYLSPSDIGIIIELEDTAYAKYYDYLDRERNHMPEYVRQLKEDLGVPDSLDVTYKASDPPYYWIGGDRYLTHIVFYHNGQVIAGAEIDSYTHEVIKGILGYIGQ